MAESPKGQLIVFLSAVSDEFRGYRARLRDDLMRAAEVGSVIQEDFDAVGEGTLEGLDARIRNSAAVVHLVGDMAGACPRPLAVERLIERCPNLPAQLGLDRKALIARDSAISYTQWEAYLAIYHGKKLYIAEAARDATRERTTYRRDEKQLASQQAHRDRLRKLMDRWHELQFDGPDDIARKLLPALAGQHRDAFTGASVWSLGARQFEAYYLKGRTLDGKNVPAPFGGRQREFDHLDRWLGDPEREPRLLVSAPAGRGKSALLAKWMEALKKSKRAGPEGWRLVFVPISNRFQTNRATVYLELLTRQLAQVAGEHVIPPAIDPELFYRSTASRLVASLAAAGTPTLLVFDGLDEALGEEHLANLLPAVLPPTVKVLASARWIAGDGDGRGWLTRLGWIGMGRSAEHDLVVEPLDSAAIADVLVEMGAPIAAVGQDRALVGRLAALTEGEPLLLRFYAEDLWLKTSDKSPITLDVLDTMQPGFGPFFKAWLQDQGGVAANVGAEIDPRTTDATLAILGFAKGALTGIDLLAIGAAGFPQLPWRLVAKPHVAPFRRFVIGDGSDAFPYVFSHPKVAEYIRTEECAGLVDRAAAAFFAWGRGHVAKLNSGELRPEKASRYALDHYAGHLAMVADTATTEDYMAMVEDGWRRAKERHDGGPAGFAADVRTASSACRRDGPLAHIGAQWRCALVLSSIKTLGQNIPGPLLVAAVRHKKLSLAQAQYYIALKGPTDEAVGALAKIATEHTDPAAAIDIGIAGMRLAMSPDVISAKREAQRRPPFDRAVEELFSSGSGLSAEVTGALVPTAFEHVISYLDDFECVSTIPNLEMLAPHLSSEQIGTALQAARKLRYASDQTRVLTNLSAYLTPEQLNDALQLSTTISDPYYRISALVELAQRMPPQQTRIIADALKSVAMITDDDHRSSSIARVASLLSTEQIGDALKAAMAIGKPLSRARALAAIISHLSLEEKQQSISGTSMAAIAKGDKDCPIALEILASHMTAEHVAAALQAVEAISDANIRCRALLALASHATAKQRQLIIAEALRVAKAIEFVNVRAGALVALAPHLTTDQIADAMQVAEAIHDEVYRSRAIVALAQHFAPERRQQALADAMETVNSIKDESYRSELLVALARHLAPEQMTKALQSAAAIGSRYSRAKTFVALAPHLGSEQRQQVLANALQDIRTFHMDRARFDLLAAVGPLLDAQYIADALQAASVIGDEYNNGVSALATLVPHLPQELKEQVVAEALRSTFAIYGERNSRESLGALAPYLNSDQLGKALEAAKSLGDDWYRARMLADLAPYLTREQMSIALGMAAAIDGEGYRSRALAGIAPHLTNPQQVADAVKAAMALEIEHCRFRALTALASHLPKGQRQQVVDDALKAVAERGEDLDRAEDRVDVLTALMPHLTPEQQRNARAELVRVAKANFDRPGGDRVLAAVAPVLGQEELADLLEASQRVRHESAREHHLEELAPYLGPPLMAEALRMSSDAGSYALSRLAPFLAPGQISAVLPAAMAIGDEGPRCWTLGTLSARVSDPDAPSLMTALLDSVSHENRPIALSAAGTAVPLIARLGGPAAIADLHRAINDVGRWYP